MEANEFERRFLEFVFASDTPITIGAVAYSARCTIAEAEKYLDDYAKRGVITLEVNDKGDLVYIYPGRTRVESTTARAADGAIRTDQFALVRQPLLAADGSSRCPYCSETVMPSARKCKHCGELIDPALRREAQPAYGPGMPAVMNRGVATVPARNPGTAAVLSFFWPGVGHIYCGDVPRGLLWMFGVFFGYVALIIPGMVLHVLCMMSASQLAQQTALPPPTR